jgi:hypothetical protein
MLQRCSAGLIGSGLHGTEPTGNFQKGDTSKRQSSSAAFVGTCGDTVDLSATVVDMVAARQDFAMNLKVLLNAFAERWVRSVKEECLSKFVLFGERSLRRAVTEFVAHFHSEGNHQGKGNVLLFPAPATHTARRHVICRERLGGLLRYYCRAA